MQTLNSLLTLNRQNNKLAIRIISPTFGHVPPEVAYQFGLTQRKPFFFFLFMLEGHTHHGVDLQHFDIRANELLFVLPHQIHRLPTTREGANYFKLGFDENCLALLPKQYLFLVNPLNNQKIHFTLSAAARLKSTFEILLDLLRSVDTEPEPTLIAY